MIRLRFATALLVLLAACRSTSEADASAASGAASARWWPSEADGPPAFTAGVSAHFSVVWAGFPEYPGVRPLCSHATRPLPHNFTRVFVTTDPPSKVASFYAAADAGASTQVEKTATGVVLTGPADERRRLETRPAAAGLPPGCNPQPGEQTIIIVMENPPYPR